MDNGVPDRVQAAAASIRSELLSMTKRDCNTGHDISSRPLQRARTVQDLNELLQHLRRPEAERKTFLYLGYGSNLSNEKFRGDRGIKPLSQVNVQVPSLRLTFDLPGLPYAEPCFANSGRRDPDNDCPPCGTPFGAKDEKTPLLAQDAPHDRYHKDRWHKGLIGVVYEVSPEDYAHIIETEGGGASYHDILVDCHPLPLDDPEAPVPQNPILPPFQAHTLFAPALPPDEPPPEDGGRNVRPDPSYAQPSARYLKLMTDGAHELGLPYEYQDYLKSIRSYTITSARQRVGSFVFLAIWAPIIGFVFMLGKMFADDRGRVPKWLRTLLGAVFKAVWNSYDAFFKPTFGEGERSTTDTDATLTSRKRQQVGWESGGGPGLEPLVQEKESIVREMV